MKHVLFTLLLLAGLGGLSGCAVAPPAPQATAAPAVYQKISAAEAKAMMADGQPLMLLDVRTPEEFSAQRIAGAVLIPDFELADRAATELPDQSARILIYCRSGRRSALAAQALAAMQYTQVYDFGGIIDWPYETVTD